MSEEPRRSFRSTKGYHSHKEQEIEGNVDLPKKKNTKKSGNKKAAASEEPPTVEANSDGDIIRCICGATSQEDDEDGEEWIACENCGTWQHNVCMGIATENVDKLPDYYCEKCRPADHVELLNALKRSEKVWEKRRAQYVAEKKARKNRKSKGGSAKKKKAESKSTPQRTNGQAKASPALSVHEGSVNAKKENANRAGSVKRKTREESQDQDSGKIKQRKVSEAPAAPATPATPATPANLANPTSSATKSVPLPPSTPLTDQHAPKSTSAPPDRAIVDHKDANRQPLEKFIHAKMLPALEVARDSGHFVPSAENSIEQQAQRLSDELEQAIYDAHPKDTLAYSTQCKSVAQNLKINPELCEKLLSNELSVKQLAVMSSDDMKSSKQRMADEAALAKAERQSIMVKEDGPRVRRTHKGEELVDVSFGASSGVPSREQRDPNANMGARSRENSPAELVEPKPDFDYTARPRQPLNIDTQAATHERKPSVQSPEFDYSKVAANLPFNANAQPVRRASGPAPIPRDAVDDPDVDRLLEDVPDVPESPPYSPKEDTDPSVVWSGQVIMSGVAKFDASAKHVGGADITDQIPSYSDLLGNRLRVSGRIEPEKANEYLCGLRWSPASDMIVTSVSPRGEVATQEFTKIFEYFAEKNRYGVLGSRMGRAQVRDIYLVPVEAGNASIPIFLQNIEDIKLPENRPERIMLIVVVYRDDKHAAEVPSNFDGNQSPSLMSHPQRQMSQVSGPAMSPLAHQGSFRSPTDRTQQQMDEDQRAGVLLAHEILGPELIRSPTIDFILPQARLMVAKEWNVIKEIFMNDERARTDLAYLGHLLAERANDQPDQQQQRGDAGISPSVRT